MGLSDRLYDAEIALVDDLERDVRECRWDPDQPEVSFAIDVLRAVRVLPGFDVPPDQPNRFRADVLAALDRYDARRPPE